MVLCAQLSDWKKFRTFQGKIRQYHLQKRNFSSFEDKVRKRRRRHGVGGNVRLRSELAQQSRMDNWIEFQFYHLGRHERMVKDIDDLKLKLNDLQTKSEAADDADFQPAAQDAQFCQESLEYAKRRLERHETLLHWIEQERILMGAEQLTSIRGAQDDQDGALKVV